MPRIMESEWLGELARLSKKDDDGLTAAEWSVKLGKSINATRAMLTKAKAMGWLKVGRRTREGLDERQYLAYVYRIVKPITARKK